jgi:putative transposase
MSEKYKFNDPEGTYFITMSIVGWIDLFTRPELKHVIIDSLKYCQKEKGLVINAWCLMPSHLHLIARTSSVPLPDIMRDFKKFTAKEIIKVLDRINESRKGWILDMFSEVSDGLKRVDNYKVWQDGNHPELIFSSEFQKQKLSYLHNNPVEAEFVDEPEYYLYSSARDYRISRKGLLEIELLN